MLCAPYEAGSPRAVAAIQGYAFELDRGLLPPGYWDVESTLWLKWRLSEAKLESAYHGPG